MPRGQARTIVARSGRVRVINRTILQDDDVRALVEAVERAVRAVRANLLRRRRRAGEPVALDDLRISVDEWRLIFSAFAPDDGNAGHAVRRTIVLSMGPPKRSPLADGGHGWVHPTRDGLMLTFSRDALSASPVERLLLGHAAQVDATAVREIAAYVACRYRIGAAPLHAHPGWMDAVDRALRGVRMRVRSARRRSAPRRGPVEAAAARLAEDVRRLRTLSAFTAEAAAVAPASPGLLAPWGVAPRSAGPGASRLVDAVHAMCDLHARETEQVTAALTEFMQRSPVRVDVPGAVRLRRRLRSFEDWDRAMRHVEGVSRRTLARVHASTGRLQLLCPEAFDEEAVRTLEEALATYGWLVHSLQAHLDDRFGTVAFEEEEPDDDDEDDLPEEEEE